MTLQILEYHLGFVEDDMMLVVESQWVYATRQVKSSYLSQNLTPERSGPETYPDDAALCRHPPSVSHKKTETEHIHTHFSTLTLHYHIHFKRPFLFLSFRKFAMLSVTRNRTLAPMGKVLRAVSTWSNVPAGPPDPILGEFPVCFSRLSRMPRSLCCIG